MGSPNDSAEPKLEPLPRVARLAGMSEKKPLPTFSSPGDTREETRWQAYQAMLRRQNDARAEEADPIGPPTVAVPLAPTAPAPPSPTGSVNHAPPAEPDRPRRRVIAGAGAAAAALVALGLAAVLMRPHAPATDYAAVPDSHLRVVVERRPTKVAAAGAAMPCYIGGRYAGTLPLEACAGRNGVASGPLDARATVMASAQLQTTQLPTPPRAPPSRPTPSRPRPERTPVARIERAPAPAYAAPPDDRPSGDSPAGGSSVAAVRAFYAALGDGDGDRAASMVVPEKREEGPLSASALTGFYSSLRSPLRITGLEQIGDNAVGVRYRFVARDGGLCSGSAVVNTTRRDGDTLVQRIRTASGC
jgi:hypothetical protein